MLKSLLLICALLTANFLQADFIEKKVIYKDGSTEFSGVLIYDEDLEGEVPGILMVPNWMGVTDNAVEKAKMIADDEYVVFIADMYGSDVRPKDAGEAGAAAGKVRGDRALMRSRAQLSLDSFKRLASEAPLDTDHIAAIGFCFGGGTVLEFARTGVDLDAVVSFHGDLVSPTLEADAAATVAKVLVLHGAADPYVPQSDVQEFVTAMLNTDADWQLVQFSGTVHSFTNPDANTIGQSDYNELSADRAFEMMDELFEELWDDLGEED